MVWMSGEREGGERGGGGMNGWVGLVYVPYGCLSIRI